MDRKEQENPSRSSQVTNRNSWPSEPDEDGNVLPLVELFDQGDPEVARQVAYHLKVAGALGKTHGYKPAEFQLVIDTALGKVTIPYAAYDPDGNHAIVYTHRGEWTPDVIGNFMQWLKKIRSSNQVRTVPVLVVHDEPPLFQRFIVCESCGVHSLYME